MSRCSLRLRVAAARDFNYTAYDKVDLKPVRFYVSRKNMTGKIPNAMSGKTHLNSVNNFL